MSVKLSRRAVLIGGSVFVSGAIGTGFSISLGAPAEGARLLTGPELRVIDAVAEVMFPGTHFPLDGIEAGVAAEVDRIVSDVLAPVHCAGFRYVLRTLEWGTMASRGRRFSRLSLEKRAEVLSTWKTPEKVARRVAGDSLRVVLGMAYFSHPDVLAAMGWRATCSGGPA